MLLIPGPGVAAVRPPHMLHVAVAALGPSSCGSLIPGTKLQIFDAVNDDVVPVWLKLPPKPSYTLVRFFGTYDM